VFEANEFLRQEWRSGSGVISPDINNVELGRHGRYRTNVWDYAGHAQFIRYFWDAALEIGVDYIILEQT